MAGIDEIPANLYPDMQHRFLRPEPRGPGVFYGLELMSKPPKQVPSRDDLLSEFSYNPDTGILSRGGRAVGSKNSVGYLTASFRGQSYLVHRIVWQIVNSDVNGHQVDHVNGDKADNRIQNLRSASSQTNSWNKGTRKSKIVPFKGVLVDRDSGRYRARIVIMGRQVELGRFSTPEAAAAAYGRAAVRKFGFYANTGAFGSRTDAVSAVAKSFSEWRKARA